VIREGDYILRPPGGDWAVFVKPMRTAGVYGVAARTADGQLAGMRLYPTRTNGQYGVLAKTKDEKNTLLRSEIVCCDSFEASDLDRGGFAANYRLTCEGFSGTYELEIMGCIFVYDATSLNGSWILPYLEEGARQNKACVWGIEREVPVTLPGFELVWGGDVFGNMTDCWNLELVFPGYSEVCGWGDPFYAMIAFRTEICRCSDIPDSMNFSVYFNNWGFNVGTVRLEAV